MTATSTVNRPSSPQAATSVPPRPLASQPEAPLLPEPSDAGLGGDSLAELSALLTQADVQDRTQARALAQTEDNAAMHDSAQEVQSMRQKADRDRDAAIWTGAGEIAGGAFTMGSAFVNASPDASGKSDGGVNWRTTFEAGANASPGIGTIAAGAFKADAEQDDASATKFGAAAQADVRAYNEAHSDAEAASDAIQKVEQFLNQVQTTRNATLLSAANYRA